MLTLAFRYAIRSLYHALATVETYSILRSMLFTSSTTASTGKARKAAAASTTDVASGDSGMVTGKVMASPSMRAEYPKCSRLSRGLVIINSRGSLKVQIGTLYCLVGMKGLEPSRLAAHAPKACVSTIPPLARTKWPYYSIISTLTPVAVNSLILVIIE